jgi:ATP-dependent RNA helicase RhlE
MDIVKKKTYGLSKPGSFKRGQRSAPPAKGRGVAPKGKGVSGINPNMLIKQASTEEVKPFISAKLYSDIDLDKRLKANLLNKGYERPTQIQEASLEQLIAGRNIVGVASTGTGKTGAFLIPVIEQLLTSGKFFTSIVVVPTRELAQQVEAEFKSLTLGLNFSVSCFIGGTSVEHDIIKAKRRNHLIVGTPGRLMDMSNRGALRFSDISVLILDEFDRMLDMGFVNDIKRMTSMMTSRRQTMLFSATVEKSQEMLITQLVENPVKVQITTGANASNSVEQNIIKVQAGEDKFKLLLDLFDSEELNKVILFAETKRGVDVLSKKLSKSGITNGIIHGDKSQNYRTKAISQFKKGVTRVLVATDVAARGIDIEHVTHVINYQLPMTMDSYIHRIGRTGRAGKKGMAYTFVD